ncbi:MAG: NAD(P)-dependent oxidoreductase [Candidatus Acidiferrales bacterium]
MKPTVGLIGLGLMGKPMGKNFLKAGFPLVVWNRSREKADELVKQGAKFADTPKDAAAAADVLITILSDPPALEQVLWGSKGSDEGVFAGLRRGSVLIDSSTVSPDLAKRVAAECAQRGVDFLDAPVTGGTWGAEKGELVFMIGGKREVLDRVEPVLSAVGKKFLLMGGNGAGQTVKIATNAILALEVQALAEAIALVTSAGVDADRMMEVMQMSMGRAPVLDVKAPLILKGEFAPSFPLRLMLKDLGLAVELAKEKNLPLPATQAAHATYSAVKATTKEDVDYAAVAKFWRKN